MNTKHTSHFVVRFLSRGLGLISKIRDDRKGPRGPREGMTAPQFASLFQTLCDENSPWVAAAALLQTVLGERGDCVTTLTVGALVDLDPNTPQPPNIVISNETVKARMSNASRSKNGIRHKRAPTKYKAAQREATRHDAQTLNRKTKARSVPLSPTIAAMIHGWMHGKPLCGKMGAAWPFEGQPTNDPSACLFPGHLPNGDRAWHKPVTRRGYLGQLTGIAKARLEQDRVAAHAAGNLHAFHGFDLAKIGTHSFKKTGVMALKDVCKSTNVVGSICGTSGGTIQKYYDTATDQRKRKAVEAGFDPIAQALGDGVVPRLEGERPQHVPKAARAIRFCYHCGAARGNPAFSFCPVCFFF